MTDTTNALGPVLRAWRDRLAPADAGLATGLTRRAAGLRREELAILAGLSVDYLVRLEQGRATNPSAQVVAALARALQLDEAERDYLYKAAGLLPPGDGRISSHVPPGIQRLIGRLGDVPLAVYNASWDLVSWSPIWAALRGDPTEQTPAQRNVVRAVFTAPGSGATQWAIRSERGDASFRAALVGDLRNAAADYPADAALKKLIAEMLDRSPSFAELWAAGAVGVHASNRKTIDHPVVGEIVADCDVLTIPGADLRIVAYTVAAGSPDAEKLDFLRVAGHVTTR